MEPRSPLPNPSLERGNYTQHETSHVEEAQSPHSPEVETAFEAREQAPSAGAATPPSVVAQPQPIQLPVPVNTHPIQQQQSVADDNPLQAADDDLIEKEWVQKAKSIVESTKHDPYQQEKQVSKLQADYMSKRYGKNLSVKSE